MLTGCLLVLAWLVALLPSCLSSFVSRQCLFSSTLPFCRPSCSPCFAGSQLWLRSSSLLGMGLDSKVEGSCLVHECYWSLDDSIAVVVGANAAATYSAAAFQDGGGFGLSTARSRAGSRLSWSPTMSLRPVSCTISSY